MVIYDIQSNLSVAKVKKTGGYTSNGRVFDYTSNGRVDDHQCKIIVK